MTEQNQRIALCEWMGWEDIIMYPNGQIRGILAGVNEEESMLLPNTSSLDVLHEMEKKLTPSQQVGYIQLLHKNSIQQNHWLKDFDCVVSEPRQRREALLRTIGKWKE